MSRSLRPRGPLDAPAQIEDLALEGLVAQHLSTLCQLRPDGASLRFWRTRGGLEVDFVLYGPGLFQAIGVKRSRCVDRRDLSALRAFVEDYREAELLLPPTTRKVVTPLNRKPGGLMEQSNASLQRGDQG